MSGFQSVMARRRSVRSSLTPSGITSWPAALRCEMTSYSVRHSSISFSGTPRNESGGTRVACIRTTTFFTDRPASQRDPVQLALLVGFREPRDHPEQMCLQLAARPAQIQIERFAARDHEPEHLVHEILAES